MLKSTYSSTCSDGHPSDAEGDGLTEVLVLCVSDTDAETLPDALTLVLELADDVADVETDSDAVDDSREDEGVWLGVSESEAVVEAVSVRETDTVAESVPELVGLGVALDDCVAEAV